MTIKLTADMLYAIAPGANKDIVDGIIASQGLFKHYGYTDDKEIAVMLGHSAVETQGFTRLEENLYYTSPQRLMQVWPKRFKSLMQANPYVRNPQKLANLVYGGRLGNVAANDGYMYRGTGLLQTTGKANFEVVQKQTNLPVVSRPELLRTFPTALEALLIFWKTNKLSRFIASMNIDGLTRAIQGSNGALAERKKFINRALKVLAAGSTVGPMPQSVRDGFLKRGSKGPQVERYQLRLQAHGYYIGGKIDGDYGEGMENAVSEFQKARGLTQDGVIGTSTGDALLRAPAVAAPPASPAPPPPDHKATEAKGKGLGAFLWFLISSLIAALMGKRS